MKECGKEREGGKIGEVGWREGGRGKEYKNRSSQRSWSKARLPQSDKRAKGERGFGKHTTKSSVSNPLKAVVTSSRYIIALNILLKI
jgi:hypothetical protein